MKFLTVEEAAERVGKSERTVREWVRIGVLPVLATVRKDGKRVRYFDEIAVLEADRTRRPGRPPASPGELAGATDLGTEGAWPADAGEFAARWNAWSVERRERLVKKIVDDAEAASLCFMQDHAELRAEVERLRGELVAMNDAAAPTDHGNGSTT